MLFPWVKWGILQLTAVESIKLLLNSSGEFQTELASVGDKALSRWTADGSEMPNIFLLITKRRPSAFWD